MNNKQTDTTFLKTIAKLKQETSYRLYPAMFVKEN